MMRVEGRQDLYEIPWVVRWAGGLAIKASLRIVASNDPRRHPHRPKETATHEAVTGVGYGGTENPLAPEHRSWRLQGERVDAPGLIQAPLQHSGWRASSRRRIRSGPVTLARI